MAKKINKNTKCYFCGRFLDLQQEHIQVTEMVCKFDKNDELITFDVTLLGIRHNGCKK